MLFIRIGDLLSSIEVGVSQDILAAMYGKIFFTTIFAHFLMFVKTHVKCSASQNLHMDRGIII